MRKLPPPISYYDDFDDTLRSIATQEAQIRFEFIVNGERINIDFPRFHPNSALLFKHIFILILGIDRAVGTAMLHVTRAFNFCPIGMCAL